MEEELKGEEDFIHRESLLIQPKSEDDLAQKIYSPQDAAQYKQSAQNLLLKTKLLFGGCSISAIISIVFLSIELIDLIQDL